MNLYLFVFVPLLRLYLRLFRRRISSYLPAALPLLPLLELSLSDPCPTLLSNAVPHRSAAPLPCAQQEFARAGKLESQVHKQRISTERERKAEEHRQKVSELTQSRKGKAEESCLYAYSGRVGTAKEVQQREAEWKQLSQQQRDAFMARAHENRADANQTTSQMRANQKDLIAQRNGAVHSERRTKEEHSAALHESQEKVYSAKKIVRDAVYLARQISPDKAKVLSDFKRKVARSPNKSPELAAELGLIESSGRPRSRETSPYRLSPRSPAEIAEAKARSIESSSMPSHTPSPSKQDQGVLES